MDRRSSLLSGEDAVEDKKRAQKEEMMKHATHEYTDSEKSTIQHHKGIHESADSPWAPMSDVMSDVREKNVDVANFSFKPHAQPSTLSKGDGHSLFAREMQARAASLQAKKCTPVEEMSTEETMKSEVGAENDRLLEGMTQEEIMQERAILLAKMDPKLVAYLQKRKENREGASTGAGSKTKTTVPEKAKSTVTDETQTISAGVESLEIINAPSSSKDKKGGDNYALLDSASRVAADPIAYDLADRCQSLMGRNRVRAILRLFDTVQVECGGPDPRSSVKSAIHDHAGYSIHSMQKTTQPPTSATKSWMGRDELCKIAAYEMHRIRLVYCKQDKSKEWALLDGISPDVDPVWFLQPIIARRDDHDILLSLFFTHALINARPEYLALPSIFTQVYGALVRLVLAGKLKDALTANLCVSIYEEYIVRQICCPASLAAIRLHFNADTPIDTFGTLLQMYTRLLHSTLSDPTVLSLDLALLPMYASVDTKMANALWHTDHSGVVRMVVATKGAELSIPPSSLSPTLTSECTSTSLLLSYACALTTKTLTATRNPLLHTAVVEWIGTALRRAASHADDDPERMDQRVVATLKLALHSK